MRGSGARGRVGRSLGHVRGDRVAPGSAVTLTVEDLVVLRRAQVVAVGVVDGLDPADDLEVPDTLRAGVVEEAGREAHDVVAVRRDGRSGGNDLRRASSGGDVVD